MLVFTPVSCGSAYVAKISTTEKSKDLPHYQAWCRQQLPPRGDLWNERLIPIEICVNGEPIVIGHTLSVVFTDEALARRFRAFWVSPAAPSLPAGSFQVARSVPQAQATPAPAITRGTPCGGAGQTPRPPATPSRTDGEPPPRSVAARY
ncbi:MAG: hypothetical protein JWP22_3677 [Ramlibacter sp.]|jgi:hypothetical protein|nr:hypothetical protein [Ramlibacter sp.]MDB5915002.1 hypothetical protein [Ramlibacter sp.]